MLNKIKNILNQTSSFDKNIVIDENTVILRDLKINSLELVSLVCNVEDEFDIEIADNDIKLLITIGDLIEYIESHQ